MTYRIAPRLVGCWMPHGTHPKLFRHRQSRRSTVAWLRIFVEGLLEAQTAQAAYYRLIDHGVAPRKAIRAAFNLPANGLYLPVIGMTGAAQSDEEHDQ
jgi:hypothetical protein